MPDLEGRLDSAIAAATTLAIDTTAAVAARDAVRARSGFPGDLYVLALAGGTGVGKSSLLNALAGSVVSTAGVQRPTTTTSLAWVPSAHAQDAAPLLDWLGGAELVVRPAATDDEMASVAVLDLPDLDSVEPSHAARVDSVLPRVDAVLWVSDPEKYADAVLHDRYLRHWLPRLGRQAFALNKTDRLSADDTRRIREDLEVRLAAAGAGASTLPILLTSATSDTSALRAWLAEGVDARAVVRQRLEAAGQAAIGDLMRVAGLDQGVTPVPLITSTARDAAVAAATDAVLRVVDLVGLRDQAVASTKAVARTRGGGPLGVVRSLVERGSGVQGRSADPDGYLRRWRERGTLAPAVQPIRALITDSLDMLPAAARPGVAALADTDTITADLGRATDRAVAGPAGQFGTPAVSRAWPLIGLLQLIAVAAVIAGAVWLVAAFLAHGAAPMGTMDLPLLGAVPTPAVLIVGGLFGAFLLGRLLGAHAAWLGRRWAARLSSGIGREVASAVEGTVLAPIAAWEAARVSLWHAGQEQHILAPDVTSATMSTGRPTR